MKSVENNDMPNLCDIIARCKKMEKQAQKKLYDLYAPVLMGIALRYGKNRQDAEDILQDAFSKILLNIDKYSETGSFEGWMKRVLINTAITYYRKNSKHMFHTDFNDIAEIKPDNNTVSDSEFTRAELLAAINSLPDGFRLVFNLRVIEGYKHREIAEILGVEVGTSKSQFFRARTLLQEKLTELKKERIY
ncbi:MAG TPA: sigma-70 family RNA polymerase sigma factor [Bacteroidales bacterium]|nr:sigma-70 family RNA polymerase sigma factor [Bacteroidales bacterium]